MYRFFFILLILIGVLSIGFPVKNPLSDIVFIPFRILGIDVSMTPITADMSMMSDSEGSSIYKIDFGIKLQFVNGTEKYLDPNDLDLYLHKLPTILYFEILGYGADMPEGRKFLCNSFGILAKNTVQSFIITTKEPYKRIGFNEHQNCNL